MAYGHGGRAKSSEDVEAGGDGGGGNGSCVAAGAAWLAHGRGKDALSMAHRCTAQPSDADIILERAESCLLRAQRSTPLTFTAQELT